MSNVLLTPQALNCCSFCLDNETADNSDPLERLLDGKVLFLIVVFCHILISSQSFFHL